MSARGTPMRIAFVGHPHHRTTGSSRFLVDALATLGSVEELPPTGDLAPLAGGAFDAVVVWQLEDVALRLARAGARNLTFFPMYDSCHGHPDSFWRSLVGVKVISFCDTLRARIERVGLHVWSARYYPEVPAEHADAGGELAGYFWQRQQEVTWRTVRALIAGAPFRRLTLHDAMDPSCGERVVPAPEEAAGLDLQTTRWFPSAADARADLLAHNVYFAPRAREGIGLAFLEAMALGLLVVAPDRPTMSEYIVSGVNGLLYDPAHPLPLGFGHRSELARRGRESIAAGRERWLRALPELLSRIADPLLRPRPPRRAASPAPASAPAQVEVVRVEAATAAALNQAVDAARGEYVLLLAPGEAAFDPSSWSDVLRRAPPGVELIVGDHLEQDELGAVEVVRAAETSQACAALRRGAVDLRWLEAFPPRTAVLWRRDFVRRLRFAVTARTLVAEEALLRALAAGARVYHCLAPLAVCAAQRPTLRVRWRRLRAWQALARAHAADRAALDRAFAALRRAARTPALHRLPAMELLVALAWRTGAAKELRRRLRRRRLAPPARPGRPRSAVPAPSDGALGPLQHSR